jgi:hypothetical protein
MNETFAQPIIETFNILAYTRDKNEEQRRRIEQQKQMNNGGFLKNDKDSGTIFGGGIRRIYTHIAGE